MSKLRAGTTHGCPGIDTIEMSPELVEVIRAHIDWLRRYGRSTTPEDYVFQNDKGRRMSRQSVGKILTEAALAARKSLCKHDLPALPHTTPHSMRRTYISTALLANNFDVVWVMKQVGRHFEDPRELRRVDVAHLRLSPLASVPSRSPNMVCGVFVPCCGTAGWYWGRGTGRCSARRCHTSRGFAGGCRRWAYERG